MKINWKVRANNWVWWAQVICAIVLPLIVGTGAKWEEMTSWALLGKTLFEAIKNPVVVVSMIVSLWTSITDPTTKGIGDSKQAMTYIVPKDDA